jgi:hypothetical protein
LLKDIYHPQIRNAVAHSEFYIVGTTLGFNNYDVAKHHPLTQISFELWEERFHRLILLYNGLIKRFNASLKEYILQQDDKEFGLQIRLTNPDETTETRFIKYVDVNRPDWMWYNHWKKNHKNK